MISSLRGTVLAVGASHVVVELGGLGLAVAITPSYALALRTGSEVVLHTALIVREDELALFGFATRDELELFDLLRGVSGVGPKSALGVLATLSPAEIARAVRSEDDAPFRKVPGIGPKTAKLITVSLSGKLSGRLAAPSAAAASLSEAVDADVVAALVGLGWPERLAAQIVGEVLGDADAADRASVQALLRLALARLGPAGARP